MPDGSRVHAGRERAAAAKRAVALAAAGGFVAALVLARLSHPGTAAPSSGSTLSPPPGIVSALGRSVPLGGGSIAPAAGPPAVSSSTS